MQKQAQLNTEQTHKQQITKITVLHIKGDGGQAMFEQLRSMHMKKWVMQIDEKSKWQWRLWSRKPCSNHDIIYGVHDSDKKQIFNNAYQYHEEGIQLPIEHDEPHFLHRVHRVNSLVTELLIKITLLVYGTFVRIKLT